MGGKTSTAAKNRFLAKKYDSLRIVVPKGRKPLIEAYAKENGMSVNGLVNELLRNQLGLTETEWKSSETGK